MIKLEMSESDIIRAIKNTQYSPLQYLASRFFKQDIRDIDVGSDCIVIWEYEADDYISYRYCEEDISLVDTFITEWQDYIDCHIEDFTLQPISFCVYKNG
ncbi:hypothetical protein EB118_19760 [bacterium]|nr:hypothetical protein [bacterium]NDG32299.1 hypothetical protein [bacterium]